jgi:hypothetical protein
LHSSRENNLREGRKILSGFQNWVGRTRGQKLSGFFINIIIPEKIFSSFSLLRTSEAETQYHARYVKRYLYGGDRSKWKRETLVEVILAECTSIIQAQESIIDFMSDCMAAEIPSGEERGITIGDISFTGHSKKLLSIVFARNNVMAIVRSVGDLDLDVKSFAKKLDEYLLSKYKSVKSKYAPKISSFVLSSQQTTVGELVKISFNAVDPKNKDLMFKLFTTAGRISLSNNDFILECNKSGSHKVELYVVNEDGLISHSKLELSVN